MAARRHQGAAPRLCLGESRFGQHAIAKKPPRPQHAAQRVGGQLLGLQPLAQGDFCRAPAQIDDQAPIGGRRQLAGHAPVNERRFLLATDDVDGQPPQQAAGFAHKVGAVAPLGQGLRGHGTGVLDLGLVQQLAKFGQAGPARLHGRGTQTAVFQTRPLAQRAFNVVLANKFAAPEKANLQTETVRSKVNGGDGRGVLHGKSWQAGKRVVLPVLCP